MVIFFFFFRAYVGLSFGRTRFFVLHLLSDRGRIQTVAAVSDCEYVVFVETDLLKLLTWTQKSIPQHSQFRYRL